MRDNMNIEVFIKANAKKSEVTWDKDLQKYVVYVKSPPVKGKANKEILVLLKEFFKATEVSLVRGHTSSTKTFDIIGAKEKIVH